MSARLAKLLQRHVALGDEWDMVPEGKVMCNWTSCGFVIEADVDDHWRDTFAEHVAGVLTAAGFGDVREQTAKLDRLAELAEGWKPPSDNADLGDTQVWYSFAKHHAAQAIRNIVRGTS